MNLVIKGADFSSVSIGKINTTLKRSAGLLGEMLSGSDGKLEFLGNTNPYLVNVYELPTYASKLNIVAKGSISRNSYSFCSGTMPTTTGGAAVEQDATSTASLNAGINVIESVNAGSAEITEFENVDIPSGAEFVLVYFGGDEYNHVQCKVEVVL